VSLSATTSAGPTLARLDELWGRYRSNWRRLFSRRAVAELTLRASFDLDLLAPERIARRIPKGQVPDCPNCQDVCCAGIENVVSLRLRDIAVLIDIDRTDLISTKKPRFPRSMLASRPVLQELVASELFQTLPVMKQVGEMRICAALTDDLRCSIHPSWPLSCERFPYSLSAIRKEVVWGRRCQSRREAPDHEPRAAQMFRASIETFNERVRDAVLLHHARAELEELGIGRFLTAPNEDPFEPSPPEPRLPILG
jgi:Fe-S-cluster containining protein